MTRVALLAASLLAVTVYADTVDTPVAMGNLGVHYNFRTVISTVDNPLTATANGPIWCQATINKEPLPMLNATFVRYADPYKRRFVPTLDHDQHKASLEIDQVIVDNMGKYRCEIAIVDDDTERVVYGNLFVYSSPFFHTNGSMHMVADEHNKNDVTSNALYATAEQPFEIRCPAVGYPKPTITWYKNREVIEDSSENINISRNQTLLTIVKFTEADEGVYTCTATNEYPTRLDIDTRKHEASLSQDVRLTSPWGYAWIYPLLVILVILLLLFIIIYGVAACRRYQSNNYNVAKREAKFGTR